MLTGLRAALEVKPWVLRDGSVPKGQEPVAGGEAQRNHRILSQDQCALKEAQESLGSSRAAFGAHALFFKDPVVALVPRFTTGWLMSRWDEKARSLHIETDAA